jgi:DNA invertase Pin-like site-specific DNA recombinase
VKDSNFTTMRVAIYARVSTLHGQNPEMQLSELREYASRREWTIVDSYVDKGVSGSKESRPELNRLMADAHRRRFDAVLVWKIDRFGRSLKHLVNAIADLAAYGVAFVSLRDSLDLSTPSGRLMFQIIGAVGPTYLRARARSVSRSVRRPAESRQSLAGCHPPCLPPLMAFCGLAGEYPPNRRSLSVTAVTTRRVHQPNN